MNHVLPLLAALLLILANAFFVAAEFAIIRLRRTRINEMAEQGNAAARTVQKILDRLDTFLSATQLGVTMTSIALGIVGEPAMLAVLTPVFNLAHLGVSPHVARTVSLILAFAVVTFFQVVFGELLPKWTVIEHAEQAAFLTAYPMNFFARLFYPFVWLLEKSAKVVAQWIGLNPDAFGSHEIAHSEDEIMAIVEAAEKSGPSGAAKRRSWTMSSSSPIRRPARSWCRASISSISRRRGRSGKTSRLRSTAVSHAIPFARAAWTRLSAWCISRIC